MIRSLYLSPLGWLLSLVLNGLAILRRPFMVYGYIDRPSRTWRRFTRVSSSASISGRDALSIGDHVWIGHFVVIDGSGGVTIGRGCQIAAGASIFSHGSYDAIRLYGDRFIEVPHALRKGYTRGPVHVGDFTFVGARAIVLPGITIGKGAIVAAGAVVTKDVPDFGIVRGVPAGLVGDTRQIDQAYWEDLEIQKSYFDPIGLRGWIKNQMAH